MTNRRAIGQFGKFSIPGELYLNERLTKGTYALWNSSTFWLFRVEQVKSLKKNCYIFFTLLAFAALFAAYPVMKWQQRYCQEEMLHHIRVGNLPDSLVNHFTDIDKDAAVQWQEEGRECYIDGRLYDVISAETIHGHKIFHCIADEREEKVVGILQDISGQEPQHIPGKKLAFKLIRELFSVFLAPAEPLNLFCFLQAKSPFSSFSYCALQECLCEIHIPPPEIAC